MREMSDDEGQHRTGNKNDEGIKQGEKMGDGFRIQDDALLNK
jgi:hypothetical protein